MKEDFREKMKGKIMLYCLAKDGRKELFNILSTIELKAIATNPGILSRFAQNCKVKGKKVKSTAKPAKSLEPDDDGQYRELSVAEKEHRAKIIEITRKRIQQFMVASGLSPTETIWKIIEDVPQEPHRELSVEEKEHRAKIIEITRKRIRQLMAGKRYSLKENPEGFSTSDFDNQHSAKRSPKHELARAYGYTGTRHVKRVLSEGLKKQREIQEEIEKHRRAIGISKGRKKTAVRFLRARCV